MLKTLEKNRRACQALKDFLTEEITSIKSKNLYRSAQDYHSSNPNLINFASNDYLGLAEENFYEQNKQTSWGSSGSRLLTGTHALHLELEKEIAKWKKTEAAIFFGSGYLANIGAISCLASPRDVIFSDELNHACILDGIKLSGAKKFFYRHNDIEHLKEILEKQRDKYQKAIIITDTVFSMDGDRARLENIAPLGKEYEASIYVDEAHASGVLGVSGAGLVEELSDKKEIDASSIEIQMGTFSKAFGVEGAYIAGSRALIDYLQNTARSFLFSTAPSPVIIQKILANLKLMQTNPQLRLKLHENIAFLRKLLKEEGITNWLNENTAIFSFLVNDNQRAIDLSKQLIAEGLLVLPIRSPTVASPRLRVCLSAGHSQEEILLLVSALEKGYAC